MDISKRKVLIFSLAGLLSSLFLHERNLYSDAAFPISVRVTLLRFFIIAFPLLLGFLIAKQKKLNLPKIIFLILWTIFIPYTIYSISEIRHVAELCRLPENIFYTEMCLERAWSLIPTFIYAFGGVMIFVFSVVQVASSLYSKSIKKQLCILALCAYASFASVFGLYTRFNVWDGILHPVTAVKLAVDSFSLPWFISNFLIFTLFFMGIVFVVNKILRHAKEYIAE
ncbi:MAG TPA: DUF1361 domain-containing protein [Candidatus Bipolaricaulota bacterium]|nr:DUF1361 domain-containing protein [Candidatus Bipolaricaulota bacterium]